MCQDWGAGELQTGMWLCVWGWGGCRAGMDPRVPSELCYTGAGNRGAGTHA